MRIDVRSFHRTPPSALARRLADGDPLDLELRCARRRAQLAYLVARERLWLRALARVSYAGALYRGEPPVERWLEGLVDEALAELLDEDETAELRRREVEDPEHFAAVCEAFDMTPEEARAACVAFNALDPDVRSAFFAVAVTGDTVAEVAARSGVPASEIAARLGAAALALLEHRAAAADELVVKEWPSGW